MHCKWLLNPFFVSLSPFRSLLFLLVVISLAQHRHIQITRDSTPFPFFLTFCFFIWSIPSFAISKTLQKRPLFPFVHTHSFVLSTFSPRQQKADFALSLLPQLNALSFLIVWKVPLFSFVSCPPLHPTYSTTQVQLITHERTLLRRVGYFCGDSRVYRALIQEHEPFQRTPNTHIPVKDTRRPCHSNL